MDTTPSTKELISKIINLFAQKRQTNKQRSFSDHRNQG